jgi:hypothetical protein
MSKRAILLIAVVGLLSGCVATFGTNQNLKNHLMLKPGMTKEQVITTMGGSPVKAEFSSNIEEWHFCNTGYGGDEFVTAYFADGVLIAMKPYTVTLNDTGGVGGSCEKFVKMGNYREPDSVREYRLR